MKNPSSVFKAACLAERLFQQFGIGKYVLDQFQAPCKVESVGDAFVERRANVHHVAYFLGAVGHDNLFLVQRADGDHNAVGAVVAQVVIDGRTLNAAEVAGENGGIITVIT